MMTCNSHQFLEPVAAILAGPASERLPRLRAAYGDPLPVLKAVIDDLGQPMTSSCDISEKHVAALEVLAELGSVDAARVLISALPWGIHLSDDGNAVVELLARVDLRTLLGGFLAAWPTLDPESKSDLREALRQSVYGPRMVRDEDAARLLMRRVFGDLDSAEVIEYERLFGTARVVSLVLAFIDQCVAGNTDGALARFALRLLEQDLAAPAPKATVWAVRALPEENPAA